MDIRSVLSRHPVLSRLRNEALDAVVQTASVGRVRRGDPVWRAGERASHFVVVAEGLVAVFAPCGPAREMLLGFAEEGDGVGEAATILGELRRDDAYGFATPSAVIRIPRDPVMGILERSGSLAMAYAQRLAALRGHADRRIASLTQTSDARIAEVLLGLVARFGVTGDEGTLIPVRITRAQLAAMVGTTVETAIRTISRWNREGLLATRDEGMLLRDVTALARIAAVDPAALASLQVLTRIG